MLLFEIYFYFFFFRNSVLILLTKATNHAETEVIQLSFKYV